jgi:hypothetical protein
MTSKQSLSLTTGVSSYLCLLALSATLAAVAAPTLSAQIDPRSTTPMMLAAGGPIGFLDDGKCSVTGKRFHLNDEGKEAWWVCHDGKWEKVKDSELYAHGKELSLPIGPAGSVLAWDGERWRWVLPPDDSDIPDLFE